MDRLDIEPISSRLVEDWQSALVEAFSFQRSAAEEDIGDTTLTAMYHVVLNRVIASLSAGEDTNSPDVLDRRQAWWHMSGFIVRILQHRHPDAQPPYSDRLYTEARERLGEAALAGVEAYFNFAGEPDRDLLKMYEPE